MSLSIQSQQSYRPVVVRVDDDENVSYLLDFLLERNGYIVIKANDGRDFLDILNLEFIPDLVLLDIMLPYIDGFELIKKIRDHVTWKNTPILVLSGCENENDIVHGLSIGADDYIKKPFQPMELIARIKRLINVRHVPDKTV